MKKQDAIREFEAEKQAIIKKYGNNDKPALREAWNNYTDMLCKNRLITQRQYDTWLYPLK